jgi:hypothetical protein
VFFFDTIFFKQGNFIKNLEVFILSKVIDNYISGGGFEKTSLIIYALGQLYLYTQIAFMLKKKIFISTLKKNI